MFFNYNRKKNIQNTAHSTKELEHFQNIQSLFFVPHFSSPYSPWPGNHYPEFCFSRSLLFLYVVFFFFPQVYVLLNEIFFAAWSSLVF